MGTTPLHPVLDPLEWLVGTWEGDGWGDYPTIEPFRWTERTRFWHVGKPVLLYEQRTTDAETGEPRHAESGFVRWDDQGECPELMVAHNTGHAEVSVGLVAGESLDLTTVSLVGSGSAKQVQALRRTYQRSADTLRVTLAMAAVGQPMTHHLASELHRVH